MTSKLGTLTTPDLIDHFLQAPSLTDGEQELLDRLVAAVHEIDMLVSEMALLQTSEYEVDA